MRHFCKSLSIFLLLLLLSPIASSSSTALSNNNNDIDSNPPVFSAVFTSCNKQWKSQSFWKTIQKTAEKKQIENNNNNKNKKIDAYITLGDAVYESYNDPQSKFSNKNKNSFLDTLLWITRRDEPVETKEQIQDAFNSLLDNNHFSEFLQNVEYFTGVNDDHDRGADDLGAEYHLNEEAQSAFLDFLGVENENTENNNNNKKKISIASKIRRERKGIYVFEKFPIDSSSTTKFRRKSEPRHVCFVGLDVRTHVKSKLPNHSKNNNNNNKVSEENEEENLNYPLLGIDQWKWLQGVLSTGTDLEIEDAIHNEEQQQSEKKKKSSNTNNNLENNNINEDDRDDEYYHPNKRLSPNDEKYLLSSKLRHQELNNVYSIDDVCIVTFIGSGTQILSDEKYADHWQASSMFEQNFYSAKVNARDKLLRMLASSGARKIVFLTGDVHLGEILKLHSESSFDKEEEKIPKNNNNNNNLHQEQNEEHHHHHHDHPVAVVESPFIFFSEPQPLYEVTSSGLTHTDPWSMIPFFNFFFGNRRRVGKGYLKTNFGVIKIFDMNPPSSSEIENENDNNNNQKFSAQVVDDSKVKIEQQQEQEEDISHEDFLRNFRSGRQHQQQKGNKKIHLSEEEENLAIVESVSRWKIVVSLHDVETGKMVSEISPTFFPVPHSGMRELARDVEELDFAEMSGLSEWKLRPLPSYITSFILWTEANFVFPFISEPSRYTAIKLSLLFVFVFPILLGFACYGAFRFGTFMGIFIRTKRKEMVEKRMMEKQFGGKQPFINDGMSSIIAPAATDEKNKSSTTMRNRHQLPNWKQKVQMWHDLNDECEPSGISTNDNSSAAAASSDKKEKAE